MELSVVEKYLEDLFIKKKFELSDLKYLINNIKSDKHFFVLNDFGDEYFRKLLQYIKFAILNITSINLYKSFFNQKLQFSLKNFNEDQFFQSLAEIVVIGGIYELINASPNDFSNFEYEKKFGLTKDVDTSVFWDEEKCNVNIEVKCPSYNEDIDYSKKILWGRLKNTNFDKELHVARRDGKAKSYLMNAHEKFNGSSSNDVNILVVCVSDFFDQTEWVSYYIQNESEDYTGGIIIDPKAYDLKINDYENVDFIIISDVYIRIKNNTSENFLNLHQCHNALFPNDNSLRNRYFLDSISNSEKIKIKKISTEEELLFYKRKYPELFKYYKVSNFFNSSSLEYLKFYEENDQIFKEKNWVYYAFLIRRDLSLVYPYIKIKISNIDAICCGNKYSEVIERNKNDICIYLKQKFIDVDWDINLKDLLKFLDTFNDDFINFLSSEKNIHKVIYNDSYSEFYTFLSLGINLYVFKLKHEKNTPVKLVFTT